LSHEGISVPLREGNFLRGSASVALRPALQRASQPRSAGTVHRQTSCLCHHAAGQSPATVSGGGGVPCSLVARHPPTTRRRHMGARTACRSLGAAPPRSHPHEHWRRPRSGDSQSRFKMEMWGKAGVSGRGARGASGAPVLVLRLWALCLLCGPVYAPLARPGEASGVAAHRHARSRYAQEGAGAVSGSSAPMALSGS
jgi:hypothetical protein